MLPPGTVKQPRLVLEPDGRVRRIMVWHPVDLTAFEWSIPSWLRAEIGWPVMLKHAPFFCCLWTNPTASEPNELATSLVRLAGSSTPGVTGRAVLAGGLLFDPKNPVDEPPPDEMLERLELIGVHVEEG